MTNGLNVKSLFCIYGKKQKRHLVNISVMQYINNSPCGIWSLSTIGGAPSDLVDSACFFLKSVKNFH